jgi:GntR family transcriptional repressor for pyruvate dehydrogenase complex
MKKDASLTEQVVFKLKQAIIRGELSPGTRLPAERELAEKYNVSRVTIRSVITQLCQLGFLKTVPKSGTFVNHYLENASVDLLVDIIKNSEKVDNEMFLALLDVRRIIEVYAAGKCAQRITGEEIHRLNALASEMELHAKDAETVAETDYVFHMEIIRIAGNPVIRVMLNSIGSIFKFYLNSYYKMPGNTDAIRPFYKKLMNALEMRDDRYASFAMAELLTFAEMGIREIMGAEEMVTKKGD